MVDHATLKPKRKQLVYDLVEQAGFDMSDWINSSKDRRGPRANPKYCYNWSFVQPRELVIFNLWHSAMTEDGDTIIHSENYRANAEFHRQNGGKSQWVTRGVALDNALQVAARDGSKIRVIIVHGDRRRTEDPDSPSSKVTARELDPELWHLRSYDWATGAFVLARGASENVYVDQFDLREAMPERRDTLGSAFVRNPTVRSAALRRARGRCEFCEEAGFEMSNGQQYLETHHIVPLSEGGTDSVRNMIALCPNDHRRAHHAADRSELREKMLQIVDRQA
jgi:hypothetical protein